MKITAYAHAFVQACLTLVVALIFVMAIAATGFADEEVTTIYIVRHAEKGKLKSGEKDPPGPDLTDAGRKRADTLAALMNDADVKAIYVNDYLRTQKTAEQTAIKTGAPVFQINDPAETVKDALKNYHGKTILIVGRTVTVDNLGVALKVEIPTLEDKQYDQMFIVRWTASKSELEADTYGEKSPD